LKALLSPLTPGKKKRSVAREGGEKSNSKSSSAHQHRTTNSNLVPSQLIGRKSHSAHVSHHVVSPVGGRGGDQKEYITDRLSIQNLEDDDEDEDINSFDGDSLPPKTFRQSNSNNNNTPTPKSPRRMLTPNALIKKLSIKNLDESDDDNEQRQETLTTDNKKKTEPKESRTPRGGRRRLSTSTKKSLVLKDVFPSKNIDSEDEDDEIVEEGPSALDIWRSERQLATSEDHVTSRGYLRNASGHDEGDKIADTKSSSQRSTRTYLRNMFSNNHNSDNTNVRYSVRKEKDNKSDPSLQLAKLILAEMGDSGSFSSKDF